MAERNQTTEASPRPHAKGEPRPGRDCYDDFGHEAGQKGRHPLGTRDEQSGDPNQAAMNDHDLEGEGYRRRGRLAATDSDEPMTDQADQAPDGDAGQH